MVHLNSNNLTIVSNDRIIPPLLEKKVIFALDFPANNSWFFFFNLKKIQSNRTKSKNGSYLTGPKTLGAVCCPSPSQSAPSPANCTLEPANVQFAVLPAALSQSSCSRAAMRTLGRALLSRGGSDGSRRSAGKCSPGPAEHLEASGAALRLLAW